MASGFEILWFVAFAFGFWIILVVLQKRTRFVALPDEIIAWLFLPDRMKWGRRSAGSEDALCQGGDCQRARRCRLIRRVRDALSHGRFPRLRDGEEHLLPVAGGGSRQLPVLPPTTGTGGHLLFFFSNGVCVVYVSVRLSCSSSLDVGSSRSLEYK